MKGKKLIRVVLLFVVLVMALTLSAFRSPPRAAPCGGVKHVPCVIEKTVTPKIVCKNVKMHDGKWLQVCKIG